MSDFVKVAYIVMNALTSTFYLCAAVGISLFTEAVHQPWIAFFIVVFLLQSYAFDSRMSDWSEE